MKLLLLAVVIAVLLPQIAVADAFWDHTGTSFAITTIGYGISRSAFKMDRVDALIFSTATSLIISTAYGLMDPGPVECNKLWYNVLGAGLSVGTTIMFEF